MENDKNSNDVTGRKSEAMELLSGLLEFVGQARKTKAEKLAALLGAGMVPVAIVENVGVADVPLSV